MSAWADPHPPERVCLAHRQALMEGTLRCPVCGQDCARWAVRDAEGQTVAWGTGSRVTVTDELLERIFSALRPNRPSSRKEILLARWAQPTREWSHRRRA
jgi:hypothetical protein